MGVMYPSLSCSGCCSAGENCGVGTGLSLILLLMLLSPLDMTRGSGWNFLALPLEEDSPEIFSPCMASAEDGSGILEVDLAEWSESRLGMERD